MRHTLRALADLDSIARTELAALNANRRRNIVLHAFDTTQFYREKYEAAGFTRTDLQRSEVFAHLPTLTREEVRSNFDRMISDELKASAIGRASTGGSTGIPLTVGTDPRFALEVISWRRLQYWGAKPSDNAGYIYRVIPSGSSAVLRSAYHFPTRRSYLSAISMSERAIETFVKRVINTKVTYLVGYVGALKILADYIDENKVLLPLLKFVWGTAAPLPRPLRRRLEQTFKVPVYSQYGSCEFYWIASERKDRAGLDVDWDIRHVEVLNESDQPVASGHFGKLIITDMLNRAFPLIRYEIGDRSRFLGQGCLNERFPILDFVAGRVSDTITLKGGRKIPGEFWTTIFDDYTAEVSSFSIHQNKDYSIIVRVVPTPGWDSALSHALVLRLEKFVDGTPLRVITSSGEVHDNGKLKFITSEVDVR